MTFLKPASIYFYLFSKLTHITKSFNLFAFYIIYLVFPYPAYAYINYLFKYILLFNIIYTGALIFIKGRFKLSSFLNMFSLYCTYLSKYNESTCTAIMFYKSFT